MFPRYYAKSENRKNVFSTHIVFSRMTLEREKRKRSDNARKMKEHKMTGMHSMKRVREIKKKEDE